MSFLSVLLRKFSASDADWLNRFVSKNLRDITDCRVAESVVKLKSTHRLGSNGVRFPLPRIIKDYLTELPFTSYTFSLYKKSARI